MGAPMPSGRASDHVAVRDLDATAARYESLGATHEDRIDARTAWRSLQP